MVLIRLPDDKSFAEIRIKMHIVYRIWICNFYNKSTDLIDVIFYQNFLQNKKSATQQL